MTQANVVMALVLTLALLASVTDLRTGLIPNWLTLPALALGPVVAAAYGGVPGATSSVLGILLAGGSALLVYLLGGLGGGDVKLFAALAGLCGPRLGLEIELFALCCALAWGILQRKRREQLLASWRMGASKEQELSCVRLGGAIFGGTLIALARQIL